MKKLKNFKEIKEPTGKLKDACWKGYTAVGTKMKGGKKVPNCVPMKEESDTKEKNEMAQTQLHFMAYAAKEINDYIEMGGEVEEWYQVKIAKVYSEFESLHSYMEGEKRRLGMVKEDSMPHKKEVEKVAAEYKKRGGAEAAGSKLVAIAKKHGVPQSTVNKHFEKMTEDLEEQHREKGRFHPTVPYVKREVKPSDPIPGTPVNVAVKREETELQEGAVPSKEKTTTMVHPTSGKEIVISHAAAGDYEKQGWSHKGMEPPFQPTGKKSGEVVDKSGAHHGAMSRVRHLARMGMKQQRPADTTGKNEEISRKFSIIMEIYKKRKEEKKGDSKFQAEPVITDTIVKDQQVHNT